MASIRERTSNGREPSWAVLYRHGGKQASKTFTGRKEASDFCALVNLLGIERALKAHDQDDRPQGVTVGELADKFLANKAHDVTERTMTDYRRDWTNWLEPWFGHREAEHVDEADVQRWVDHMRGRLSPKSVTDRHMLLHQMFEFGRAKSRRLVDHNPCKETDLPKRVKSQPKGTTPAEHRALLAGAERKGNEDARDLILFLGETGWRFSEATALDVRDVEDDGVNVWVTVSRVFRIDASGRQVIAEGAAKTDAGFRRIVMWPDTAAMIRRRVLGKRPGDLVFTNSRGNPWNQNTFLRTTWPGIKKEAGLERPITPHWLRHMHVAVCAKAGVPMHEIQRRIGHEHYSTTVDVYGRTIGDMSPETIVVAAAIMSGKAVPTGREEVVLGEVVLELD